MSRLRLVASENSAAGRGVGFLRGPAASGGTCIYATEGPHGCTHVCYAGWGRMALPMATAVLRRNTEALRDALSRQDRIHLDMIGPGRAPVCRWFTAGDCLDPALWCAIYRLAASEPWRRHLAFTRGPEQIMILRQHGILPPPNLVIMASVDRVNAGHVVPLAAKLGLGIAVMGAETSRVLGLPGRTCRKLLPVDHPDHLPGSRLLDRAPCILCGGCRMGETTVFPLHGQGARKLGIAEV